ncbi:hypothetical protein F5B19DRAFT_500176 [Rostrohypoxylon terebratum]|nr:hypothetical protein F5B19DRAFT_500176 [Rostrohypoxylon terebratum]
MGESPKKNPKTPTRIPRPSSPASGATPTRSSARRGTGLLSAAGQGNLFRGRSLQGVSQVGVWPLNTTVIESHGLGASPTRPAARQSGILPPSNINRQQDLVRPSTSRGPSDSTMTGSPESQTTTDFTSATTSTSPEGITGVGQGLSAGNRTMTVSPMGSRAIQCSNTHPYAPQIRHRYPGSNIPVPSPRAAPPRPAPAPGDVAYIPANAWTAHELVVPKKLPPAGSENSLGSKHRDSLRITSVQNIPRLTPPAEKKSRFSRFFSKKNKNNHDSADQNSGSGSEGTHESSVFEDWPPPVQKLSDNPELGQHKNTDTKEPLGATNDEGDKQEEVIESQDDKLKEEVIQKDDSEEKVVAVKECCDSSPTAKDDDKEPKEVIPVKQPLRVAPAPEAIVKDHSDLEPENSPAIDRELFATQRNDWLELRPLTNIQESQSPGATGHVHKTFDLRSQLPRLTQKAGGEKENDTPKSRTRNVLNNLTTSISRASLSSFRMHPRRHTPSAVMASPAGDDSPAVANHPRDDGGDDLISRQQRASHHLDSFRLIYEAQDDLWWSGRFSALQDRFRSANLSPENMAIIIGSSTKIPGPISKPQSLAGLPSSSTMAQLPSRTAPSGQSAANKQQAAQLTDEDALARRVFDHLHALCRTDAARKSLFKFQQNYARKHGKESLLPDGGTMPEDPVVKGKRWVGRIFTGKDKDKDGSGKKGPSR